MNVKVEAERISIDTFRNRSGEEFVIRPFFEQQEYYRKRVWKPCQLIVGGFFLQPRKSEMISLVVSWVEALCVKTLLLLQNQTWNKKSVAKLYFSKSILTATIILRFDVASKAFWNCFY